MEELELEELLLNLITVYLRKSNENYDTFHCCSHPPMFHQRLIHVARPCTSMAVFSHSDSKSWNRLWSKSNESGENMDRTRKNAQKTLIADLNQYK